MTLRVLSLFAALLVVVGCSTQDTPAREVTPLTVCCAVEHEMGQR